MPIILQLKVLPLRKGLLLSILKQYWNKHPPAIFANSGQPNRVCLGDGAGGFSCSDVSSDTNSTFGVALGDVDGDNALDAVFAEFGPNRVCLGDGAGGFSCSDFSSDTNSTRAVALGEVDGDVDDDEDEDEDEDSDGIEA